MTKKWRIYLIILSVFSIVNFGFNSAEFNEKSFHDSEESLSLMTNVANEHEFNYYHIEIPFVGKSFVGFKQALGFRESKGRYDEVSVFGYLGKYQFGIQALNEVGINDKEEFLKNPILQEKALYALLSINKFDLLKEIEKFEGEVINGVTITESGILASAHLLGTNSVKKYLYSRGKNISIDGFGTSINNYMKYFSGYDTSFVIPNSKAKAK